MTIKDDFESGIASYWTQVLSGGAAVHVERSVLRLGFESAQSDRYTDAQIDDYTLLGKSEYRWRPPLKMTIKARFSHNASNIPQSDVYLNGTAGFGFWNKPFSMQGGWFAAPESVWFFSSSPPSRMLLVPGLPGCGWKAQVVHTRRLSALLYAIPLALAIGYARITGRSGLAAKLMQRFTGTSECMIDTDMTAWHEYVLEWHADSVEFFIDGKLMHTTDWSPNQNLGFVAWLDNEYAVATPKGEIKFGKCISGKQWLEIDRVVIEKM